MVKVDLLLYYPNFGLMCKGAGIGILCTVNYSRFKEWNMLISIAQNISETDSWYPRHIHPS